MLDLEVLKKELPTIRVPNATQVPSAHSCFLQLFDQIQGQEGDFSSKASPLVFHFAPLFHN